MAEGMRRRATSTRTEESASEKAFETLRHFDVYAKVHDDYLQRSGAGGVVTVITGCIILFLFWSEFIDFCTTEIVDSISVDTRINQKLPIGLNITFPHLRCEDVSVDTVDSAGDGQVNIVGGLDRWALDGNGLPVKIETPAKDLCLSCLAAEDEQHKCCNTCQDLKVAFKMKGLVFADVEDSAEQCKFQVGCQVCGKVIVNKVSGNVHVALGRSAISDGRYVHDFSLEDIGHTFNTSHEIHSITFGDHVPGLSSPLDGTVKIVTRGAYMFHYYIKLVPTVFLNHDVEIYTNQYSVTDSARNVQVQSGVLSGLPGVFIVYDFSPFLMRKVLEAKPWSYIFKSSCALIGGVFSIATLVEMIVQKLGFQSLQLALSERPE
eukprot:NODE_8443_length_1495_cov_5.529971.p1 GENE.NODE_8443_length_1495_cov_5.529971~~NODE_8443_length_1495_cov_5.529971.p1  ORF type:complete len:408 (-),score=126.50 NODE_8443_length_1495_cov_5.529971:270-1400(-)